MQRKKTAYSRKNELNIKFGRVYSNEILTKKITGDFLRKCAWIAIDDHYNRGKPEVSRNYSYNHTTGKVTMYLNPVNGIYQTKKSVFVLDAVREINFFFNAGYRIHYYMDHISYNRGKKSVRRR